MTRSREEAISDEPEERLGLFLDSGAYSAFTQGVPIDIDEYVSFIKKHRPSLSVAACLDVIGDGEATYQNFKYMEEQGADPMPVYHQGTDEKFLLSYLDQGYDYIALGGMVGGSSSSLKAWLDRLFDRYLTDAQGNPTIKVHGFGITGFQYLWRYPWYSVDSTSWLKTAAFGVVLVPKKVSGGWCYDSPPTLVTISDKNPDVSVKGKHYTTVNPIVRQVFDEYFEYVGYTAEILATEVTHRKRANIRYFRDLEHNFVAKPFDRSRVSRGVSRGT